MQPVIIIPARRASARLPDKPLADIAGRPMIAHVIERAEASGAGEVWVATDDKEIIHAAHAAGAQAIMTQPEHPSGSDRIWEALNNLDETCKYDTIINLQGDLPTIDPALITLVTPTT